MRAIRRGRRGVAAAIASLGLVAAGRAGAQTAGTAQATGTAQAAPATASPAPSAGGCDASCVRSNAEMAGQLCAPRVEAEAPTDFEWVSRPVAKIFQQAEAPEPTSTLVRYRGDSIRFLSPQKEWVRVTYECGFDAEKHSVVYVRVRLGRLDRPDPPAQASQQAQRGAPAAQDALPRAPGQAAANAAPPRKLLPSEPSEIEIRQVTPARKRMQP